MNNKKISVITPTYNRDWCIADCIKSVLSQNYKNWELLIIDDGSTDKTKEKISSFLKDKRIKYFYQENKGVNSARNLGIKKARGDILVFLDSDDYLVDFALKEINSSFSKVWKSNIGEIIFKANANKGRISKIKKEGVGDYKSELNQEFAEGDLLRVLKRNIVLNNSLFFPSEIFGGLENIFWLEVAKRCKIRYVNKELLNIDFFRKELLEKDNLTSYKNSLKRAKSMILGYDIIIKNNYELALKYNPIKISNWYKEKALWQIISGNYKEARKDLRKARHFSNNKFALYPYTLISFLPKNLIQKVFLRAYYLIKERRKG